MYKTKKKFYLVFFACSMFLSACNSSDENLLVTTCTLKSNTESNMIMEFTHDENLIYRSVSTTLLSEELIDGTVENFIKSLEDKNEYLKGIKGITYEVTANSENSKQVIEKIIIDYTKVDFERLTAIGLYVYDEEMEKQEVSYDKSVDLFEKTGFDCSSKY